MNNSEIEKLLKQSMPNVNSNYDIECQAGGLTNNNCKVNINNDCYVLRTIKKSSEKMINRLDECKNNKIVKNKFIPLQIIIKYENILKSSNWIFYKDYLEVRKNIIN